VGCWYKLKVINLSLKPQNIIHFNYVQSTNSFESVIHMTLLVPPQSIGDYRKAEGWKDFGIIGTYSVTGSQEIGTQADVHAYTTGGRLHVNSPATEQINVYSVTGTLLYSFNKPAGAFTLSRFRPSSVLIVKGNSGWTRKITDY
jgi:hypothetical protein